MIPGVCLIRRLKKKKGVHLHGMEAPQFKGQDVSLIVLSMMRDDVWK